MRLPLKNNQRAQAAAELAVFGAILVFLMGTIVRTGVSSSYQQNQQLKAMRQALLKSYESSRKNEAGHNATSILYIEDRITPDIGKYGSMERVPYIMQGSGTLSNMLMYPLDLDPDFTTDKEKHIPVMDVYINGKHFAFSTAAMSPNKPLGPPPGFEISYGTPPDPRGDGTFRFQGWDFNCLPVLDSAGNTVIYGCQYER